MSRFFSEKYAALVPYVPGEQPRDTGILKLNTNESPFPPSALAVEKAAAAAAGTRLYSDTDCTELRRNLARVLDVDADQLICSNGSDEVLNYAFMAFCDSGCPAVFPDVTYGFYPVFADVNLVPYRTVPLTDDLTVDVSDYFYVGGTVFIANPNAPTGIALSPGDIEEILRRNPDNVVVVDEAYVDFGAVSCVPLIKKYDNLLVIQTFSKSRSMAGARLGFGVVCGDIIRDLNTIRFSLNPYNVNSMTMAAGAGALLDEEYTRGNCRAIIAAREYTASRLRELGFTVTDSMANFVFARHPSVGGTELYTRLREKRILVRHFSKPDRIRDYNRITIGTMEQMRVFIRAIESILEELP